MNTILQSNIANTSLLTLPSLHGFSSTVEFVLVTSHGYYLSVCSLATYKPSHHLIHFMCKISGRWEMKLTQMDPGMLRFPFVRGLWLTKDAFLTSPRWQTVHRDLGELYEDPRTLLEISKRQRTSSVYSTLPRCQRRGLKDMCTSETRDTQPRDPEHTPGNVTRGGQNDACGYFRFLLGTARTRVSFMIETELGVCDWELSWKAWSREWTAESPFIVTSCTRHGEQHVLAATLGFHL